MAIVVDVNLLEEDGKQYIEIDVPHYPTPISCKGVYYYRSGSTRQVLTGAALEKFLLRKQGLTWDNLPFPRFKLADVDDTVVAYSKELQPKRGALSKVFSMNPRMY